MAETATGFQTTSKRLRVSYSAILLAVLIIGLIGYKGYSGLTKLQHVRVSGSLELRDDLLRTSPGYGKLGFVVRSAEYLRIVWPALLFGILIAAWVHAFVSPTWFLRRLGKGTVREQIAAAMSGTPLMLCSCCASPLFATTYERSQRLSPSLALMLASAGLNPASLLLCFILFPTPLAAARLVMTLLAVLFASRLLELVIRRASESNDLMMENLAVGHTTTGSSQQVAAYLRSCGHVAIRTIPLILLGTLLAMLTPARLVTQAFASTGGGIIGIALVALFAVILALPTFFEIPLTFSILAAGAPLGAAAAVLFAGPIINFPSLLVVGRYAGWRVSAVLALSIWVIAILGGFALH